LEDLRPEDVVYRVLHGLRALLRYDHSSAVLLLDGERQSFILKAEQIAWKKGKSDRIGATAKATPHAVAAIARAEGAFLFRPGRADAAGDDTRRALFGVVAAVAAAGGAPPEGAVLAAPLSFKGQPIGILKVSARNAAAFDEGDLSVVRAFMGAAAAALHR